MPLHSVRQYLSACMHCLDSDVAVVPLRRAIEDFAEAATAFDERAKKMDTQK